MLNICGILIFFTNFFVYLKTLTPTVYVGDSGELIAAAASLGIPHPPGYPLFVYLGKLFCLIFPFGSIAFRLNLMSAFFAAAAAALVYFSSVNFLKIASSFSQNNPQKKQKTKIIAELNQPVTSNTEINWIILIPSVFSSLILAFSRLYWSHAVFAEVFALNAFMASLTLFLLIKIGISKSISLPDKGGLGWVNKASNDNRILYLLIFTYGLSLCNHHTILLVLPAYLYLLWIYKKKLHPNWNISYLLCILVFFLGLALYIHLPIAAKNNNLINWGNPSNWERFFRTITRADYGGTFSINPVINSITNIKFFIDRLWIYIFTLSKEFIFIGFIFGLLGFWFDRTRFLLLLFICTGLSFPLLLTTPVYPSQQILIERFYIISMPFFAISMSYGISNLFTKFKQKIRIFSVLILLIIVVFQLSSNYFKNDRSKNTLVFDYGMNILKSLPHNAILFLSEGDAIVNSLVYLNLIESIRPDVNIYEAEVRIFKNIYGNDYIGLSKPQRNLRREMVYKQFISESKRPIYFSTQGRTTIEGIELEPYGITFRSKFKTDLKSHSFTSFRTGSEQSERSQANTDMIWQMYRFERVYDSDIPKDYRARTLVANYHYYLAESYFAKGKTEEGIIEFKETTKIAYDMEWILNNIGNIYGKLNLPEEEIKAYEYSIKINPYMPEAHYNLGISYDKKGEYNHAIIQYENAIEIKPDYTKAIWNLARLYYMRFINQHIEQDRISAINLFEKYIRYSPYDQEGIKQAKNIIYSLSGH
ncbi:MAG: DUF2723 domain-containing protein [Candidatus Firestonebacteria bacterium]